MNDTDIGYGHLVPGLEDTGHRVVRPDLNAPGVRANAGDLFLVNPIDGFKCKAGGVASRVAAPFALIKAVNHLAGIDDHKIAATSSNTPLPTILSAKCSMPFFCAPRLSTSFAG